MLCDKTFCEILGVDFSIFDKTRYVSKTTLKLAVEAGCEEGENMDVENNRLRRNI